MNIDKVQEAKKAYYKEYREKNKEKLAEAQRNFHATHPGKRKEYQDKWWLRKSLAPGEEVTPPMVRTLEPLSEVKKLIGRPMKENREKANITLNVDVKKQLQIYCLENKTTLSDLLESLAMQFIKTK